MSPTPTLYNSAKLYKWSVREINGTTKKGEVVNVFREGKFELLALMETKLKGNEELSLRGINGIIVGVQEMEKTTEGVGIWLKNVWHNTVTDFGCVSYRVLWIKFRFSRVKVSMVEEYGPNGGNCEEKERFWNDIDMSVDRVDNGYRLCILGDLNG